MTPNQLVEKLLDGDANPACITCGSTNSIRFEDPAIYLCTTCDELWNADTGQRVEYGGAPVDDVGDAGADDANRASPAADAVIHGSASKYDVLGDDDAVDWNQWHRNRLPDPAPVPLEVKRQHTVFEHDPFIIIKMPADEEFVRREGFDMEHPVSGDTKVLTREGSVPIRDLFGRQVEVLTCPVTDQLVLPAHWATATFHRYDPQPLFAVTLQRADKIQVVRATATHRWYAACDRDNRQLLETRTYTLQPGQCIPAVEPGQLTVTEPWVVLSVEPTGQVDEVFCASVPPTGVFVLEGGILTGNCLLVAYKEYCERLRSGAQVQFSLVDTRDGLPKVDFELSLKRSSYGGPVTKPVFTQIRGKRNQCPPADEYLPALMAFFEAHPEWQLAGHGIRNFDGGVDGDKVLARWKKLQARGATGSASPGAEGP